MRTLLKNANVFTGNGFRKQDVVLVDGNISFHLYDAYDSVEDLNGKYLIPGFADVHVHLREPGFSYKETIATGTMAAARGGFTAVCAMPNLKPIPSNRENLEEQLKLIKKDAVVHVYPYGSITARQCGAGVLADMEAMKENVCGYTDDGKGVQGQDLMEEAMKKAASIGKMIVAHCEDESLLEGGYIHKGTYAKEHGHRGICSESEWRQVERDIELAKKTGVQYHVCHVSTKESVELIRKAKAEGVRVTCETCPHYLVFTEDDLQEDGKWKMNPPIRSKEDKEALIRGIQDGTVDCIVTDHAPHSAEEKSRGLEKSAFGIVGLETSFPVVYTRLVKTGVITLEKMVELMSVNPRRIFSLPGGRIEEGAPADLAVLDLNASYTVDPDTFFSKGKATPFEGMQVFGEVTATFVDGKKVYSSDMLKK